MIIATAFSAGKISLSVSVLSAAYSAEMSIDNVNLDELSLIVKIYRKPKIGIVALAQLAHMKSFSHPSL